MTIPRPLVLACCITAAACGGSSEQPAAPANAPAPAAEAHQEADPNVVKVESGMLRDLRITVGEVESRPGGEQIVLLGELAVDERGYAEIATPAAARVTKLFVTAGQAVRAGQILAELTSPELGKARADYLTATARAKLAQAALERKRSLAAERIAPLREVQEAEHEVAEAEGALRNARAAIGAFGVPMPSQEAEATSSSFALRSPVGGAVISRAAVVGQTLDPAAPAFRVAELSTLWLTVHAFERDAVRIDRGVAARIAFAALPGQDFEGKVAVVGREVERESRTVPVRIDVRNGNGLLRPGMSATATLPVGATGEQILTVPVAAVQRVRNEWCVFLPKDASTFEIRRIGRGRDLGDEVEVLSGLDKGEKIVVEGAFLLKAHSEKGQGGHDDHH